MNRNRVALIAVVAAVALAGCGGLGGDSGTPTDQSPANATDGPDETPQTVETDGPYDLPLNGADVTERHREALTDAATFEYRRNTTTRALESGAVVEYHRETAVVDRRNDTYRVVRNVSGAPVTEVYAGSDGTRYLRQRLPNQTAYDRQNRTGNGSESYLAPGIERYLDELEYSYEGTEQVGNDTVHVYAADGTGELLVTDNGRIRTFRLAATGSTSQGLTVRSTVELEYANVGTATVESPVWLGQAAVATSD